MNKKLKIVLVSPGNLDDCDSESGRSVTYGPNLGLSYISKYVEKLYSDNVEITIIETVPQGFSINDVWKKIERLSPDIVGISSKTFNILSAYKLFKFVKLVKGRTLTVLGGAHGTALPELTLQECPELDIIVIGEGEMAFSRIIGELLENKRDFSNIGGIVFRNFDGKVIKNSNGKLLSNLDEIPFPTYEKYNMKDYNIGTNPINHKKENYFSMFGSRGCPYVCTFCMPLLSRNLRKRDPEKILQEIEILVHEMNAGFIYFEDSCMTVDEKWFVSVCDEMIISGISNKLSWGFQTRVDVVNKKLFEKAFKAGCKYVNFGFESGSDYVLRKNRKIFKTKDILTAISNAREAGIKTLHGSFIIGLPYETKNTVQETMNFIDCIDVDMIPINLLDVYPGTELFDMVENEIGGIRWLPGCRLNWKVYERNRCQTAVNDLSEDDLLYHYNQALDLVEKKTNRRFVI